MTTASPLCQECEDDLVPVGTHWVCHHAACGRYALPCPEVVGEFGYTAEEYEQECERDWERRSGASEGNYYSSERMDAARRIGE